MSNRISGILLITLIALCVIIVMEARSGIPSANRLRATPVEDKGATVAGPLRVALPPLGALIETVERPLFSETRRPPDEESNGEPISPAAVPMGPGGKFVLSAIVITDDARAVLIANPQDGEPIRVTEGETIAGWRLDSVENDRAVFSKDGETREVALRIFGPPPLRRPQRAPPTPPGAMTPEQALRRALSENGLRPSTIQKEPATER